MKTYLISEDIRQEVLKYLWIRPYGEVFRIMDSLLKLEERKEDGRTQESDKKKIWFLN